MLLNVYYPTNLLIAPLINQRHDIILFVFMVLGDRNNFVAKWDQKLMLISIIENV